MADPGIAKDHVHKVVETRGQQTRPGTVTYRGTSYEYVAGYKAKLSARKALAEFESVRGGNGILVRFQPSVSRPTILGGDQELRFGIYGREAEPVGGSGGRRGTLGF